MLSLNPVMNMPEVTLTFKCGVITSNGLVDPDSYKFLTWSYVAGNSSGGTSDFSHISLAERVSTVYPHLGDESTRIVYVGIVISTFLFFHPRTVSSIKTRFWNFR